MPPIDVAPQQAEAVRPGSRVVNDFSLQIATVNGSGSQTANNTLIRAIHKMGIPASGKNLFPSNIQGLPLGSPSASAKTATLPAASPPKFWWR